jgi:hypothetical protein
MLVCFASSACSDDAEHRAVLDALVRQGAKQEEVKKQLGPNMTIYERGTQSWADLQSFLSREPPTKLVPLRQAVEKYPRILYYTTAWRMTWIFLDEQGSVRAYYLTGQ